jgi:hypothetical protein
VPQKKFTAWHLPETLLSKHSPSDHHLRNVDEQEELIRKAVPLTAALYSIRQFWRTSPIAEFVNCHSFSRLRLAP